MNTIFHKRSGTMLFKIYFLLPVALLLIASFFGLRPWRYAFSTLIVWWTAAALVFTYVAFDHMLMQFAVVSLMVITGPMIAVVVSLQFAPIVRPAPADYAYEAAGTAYRAYENLSPERKAQVHQAAQASAKFACKQAGKYFRRQRRHMYADAFSALGKAL